ncbi:MAG: methyltransferase domain-containing protein [Chitinispirillia bacterium]|jgi:ubiquinone/menaquinone biosynthesis C-methylase UbiE
MAALNPEMGNLRDFSENRHKHGNWKTKLIIRPNRFYIFFLSFLSFKRAGVYKLSSRTKDNTVVLDLGSGKGSYSHWYLSNKPDSKFIAVDWSLFALKNIPYAQHYSIQKVCADIHHLPFKPNIFTDLFSVDTLGHVSDIEQVLEEILRVTSRGCNMFIHSECNDYQKRWPDSLLMRINKKDVIAELDGHFALHSSNQLLTLYEKRFRVKRFFSPAGILGWLLGYPEKYRYAFQKSGLYLFFFIVLLFSGIKKAPLFGPMLRFVNSLTNRVEVIFGIHGGGSCFAFLEKK